jgi:hypothetical protein
LIRVLRMDPGCLDETVLLESGAAVCKRRLVDTRQSVTLWNGSTLSHDVIGSRVPERSELAWQIDMCALTRGGDQGT